MAEVGKLPFEESAPPISEEFSLGLVIEVVAQGITEGALSQCNLSLVVLSADVFACDGLFAGVFACLGVSRYTVLDHVAPRGCLISHCCRLVRRHRVGVLAVFE